MKQSDETWLLMGGKTRLAVLDNEQDAKNALMLAWRHTALCFIGRTGWAHPGDEKRTGPLPGDALHHWKGTSTIATVVSPESCITYDPSRLNVVAYGSTWLVMEGNTQPWDGPTVVLQLMTRNDAFAAIPIAKQYRAYCTIGHDPGPGVDDPVNIFIGRDTWLHYF